MKRNLEALYGGKTKINRQNYKEIISAKNKEEFSSSPSNTNMGWPTSYGDGRLDECWGGEERSSMGVRHWMWDDTGQCLRLSWRAGLRVTFGPPSKSCLPHGEETLLRGRNQRRTSKILLLTRALAGSGLYSSTDEIICLESEDSRESPRALAGSHSLTIPVWRAWVGDGQ